MQPQLWVFYEGVYQWLSLDEEHNRITIGNSMDDTITIQSIVIRPEIVLKRHQNGSLHLYKNDQNIGELQENVHFPIHFQDQTIHLVLRSEKRENRLYYIGNQYEVPIPSFSNNKENSFSIVRKDEYWEVNPYEEEVYLNGHQLKGKATLTLGDEIFHPFLQVVLKEDDVLSITSDSDVIPLPKFTEPTSEMKQKYPYYRRTPRMYYELPDEKVSFTFPSPESDDNNRTLWLIILPPLVMLLVMGFVAIVIPRGIFIIISLVMFTTTIITSSVQYFKEKKNTKQKKAKRKRLYTKYLEDKREELTELSNKQLEVLQYQFPTFERLKYLTFQINNRIWERTLTSEDFLHIRVGLATLPSSYDVSVHSRDMSNQEMDDLLEKAQQMVEVYSSIRNAPLTIDAAIGAVGLIGKDSVVKREIHQMIGQLAFFNSYHDVRFIAIFDEEEYAEWEWMKWLPHFRLPHFHGRGFIYNEQTRDQFLTSIYEMIKQRDLEEQDNQKEQKVYAPHFIFIVTNRQLISEHLMLEYLEGEFAHLGISTIFAADTKESLSDNIHTLIRYINAQEGDILIQDQKAVHIPFKLDAFQSLGNERFARLLFSLEHQLGMSNSIPKTVSYLEMFHVNKVEQLALPERWSTNNSSKSLAVPIGLKGKDDLVELNLHEKAHGPHGLLAGTTGSGKSELLQTYILSLAVHFHPYEVAFLLIDYKGGGMAQAFKHIPHLLGTITNIEGSKNFSARALASIKSELKRRQRLFDQYEVNHINDYTDLYRSKKADQPMPHLFIISDEFAELKNEEPDFIKELVSAARIGRSLGIHLILATQKPGGIIDDQIWSNARFRISLKVQDANDSKEILKNADAAKLTITGRGYLQVGNNELYQLFQSAWSGAPYKKDTFGAEDSVSLVTDLGLVPLSDVSTKRTTTKVDKKTEIDAIAEEIVRVQEKLQIKKLSSPWLPPLPLRLTKKDVTNEDSDSVLIGITDEPEKQLQSDYYYKLNEDGNIGVFGSSGYGKSITLMTLLLGFAQQKSSNDVHFYIFDFGNGALLPLRQLPHIGDYFRSDDQRKIEKFLTFMQEEMERRRELFRDQEVSNIKLYNAIAKRKLPLFFVTIDNFDLIKEEMQEIENRFIQIARDGQSLGIYTILTATRANAIRQALMNNLKTKIVHYLMDASEKTSLLGRTQYELEAIPGRAYIQKDSSNLAHICLPAEGANDMEVLDNAKAAIDEIKQNDIGTIKPKAIPMLPNELDESAFYKHYVVDKRIGMLPIGLDEDRVQPTYINMAKNKHCLIVGQAQKGKTNVLKILIHTLLDQSVERIAIFDTVDRGLVDYAHEDNIQYMNAKDHVAMWIDEVKQEFAAREQKYQEHLQLRSDQSIAFPPIYLVIDGFGNFLQNTDSLIQDGLSKFMKNNTHLGFHLIVAGNANEYTKGFDPFSNEVKQIRQAILLMKKMDQNLFTLPYTRNEPEIQPGFGYIVENGKETKIQVPQFVRKRVVIS